MDNLPRVAGTDHVLWGHEHMTWVDATMQAILSGKILLLMAEVLGRQTEVQDLRLELEKLVDYSNKYLWHEQLNFYCDRFPSGELSTLKHIGAYWALLAGCTPRHRISDLVAHLENPAEFNRPHRIPALSADDPNYSGTGGYWCGGVWAPTNFMVLKGLGEIGFQDLAHRIAVNHVENVVKVFESDDTVWTGAEQFRQFFHLTDLIFDDKHTLWENYAPDVAANPSRGMSAGPDCHPCSVIRRCVWNCARCQFQPAHLAYSTRRRTRGAPLSVRLGWDIGLEV
jgi:hypothetical protein